MIEKEAEMENKKLEILKEYLEEADIAQGAAIDALEQAINAAQEMENGAAVYAIQALVEKACELSSRIGRLNYLLGYRFNQQ